MERTWLEPPTAPKSGPTDAMRCPVMSGRCSSGTETPHGHRLSGELGDRPEPHVVAGVGGLEDLAVADVDRDVVRCGCVGVGEEDEIAGLLVIPVDAASE